MKGKIKRIRIKLENAKEISRSALSQAECEKVKIL